MNKIKKTLAGITTSLSLIGAGQSLAGEASKSLAVDLLERGLVNADTAFIKENVHNDYIQHNPLAPDGLDGLLGFVGYLETLKDPIAIKPVRVLQENDLVLVHSEYDLEGKRLYSICFALKTASWQNTGTRFRTFPKPL